MVTTSENEGVQYGNLDRFPSGSSQEGTPAVEVIMPRPNSPGKGKRVRASLSKAIDRAKKARCVVGSPSSRLINQMATSSKPQMTGSPLHAVARSPRNACRNGILRIWYLV